MLLYSRRNNRYFVSTLAAFFLLVNSYSSFAAEAALTISENTFSRYLNSLELTGSRTGSITIVRKCKPKVSGGVSKKSLEGADTGLSDLASITVEVPEPNIDKEAVSTKEKAVTSTCNFQLPVPYSWVVKELKANISTQGMTIHGTIEARWKKRVTLTQFTLNADVAYRSASGNLRFTVANDRVPLNFSYRGIRYTVGNVRFRRRLSTNFPLTGLIPRPGPDLEVTARDVTIQYRPNAIRIEGDIDL